MSLRENLSFETRSAPTPPRCTAWSPRWSSGAGDPLPARSDARGPRDDAERDRVAVGLRHAISRRRIPVRAEVAAACELLGLDPLYVANEGKLVAICAPRTPGGSSPHARASARPRCRAHRRSRSPTANRFVQMDTRFGGRRVVDWLTGEQLPRIC
jgi:hydrogenase expression/formation protein HypE